MKHILAIRSSDADRSAINDALRTAKSPQVQELESGIDSLERCTQACAFLVVIGVILEVAFDSTSLGFKIGGSSIALGVAGELLFGILASRKQGQLRNLYALEIAKLNQTAEHERLERIKIQQTLAGLQFGGF